MSLVFMVGIGVVATATSVANERRSMELATAARSLDSMPNMVEIPPLEALSQLETLRMRLDTLSRYVHDGIPLRQRLSLYNVPRSYSDARLQYFTAFNTLIFGETRAGILVALRGLPDTPQPADDYGATYALLKAYIVTTSHPEKSTADFLVPVLMTRWLGGRAIDSARALLASKQFETYATELKYANPFPDFADAIAVAKARTFLRQFAGSERIIRRFSSTGRSQTRHRTSWTPMKYPARSRRPGRRSC
jgi:type VI secretion system protein ImpL